MAASCNYFRNFLVLLAVFPAYRVVCQGESALTTFLMSLIGCSSKINDTVKVRDSPLKSG